MANDCPGSGFPALSGMRNFLILCLLMICGCGWFAQSAASRLDIEHQVAEAVQGPQVTVVHFWAPWCPNSQAELGNQKWSRLIEVNRDVKFIFVTVRSPLDGAKELAEYGVGGEPTFTLLHHPNQVKDGAGAIQAFMGQPLTWIPTTWVFRDGKLCYALNYGEVRFLLLQQLIRDAAEKWAR